MVPAACTTRSAASGSAGFHDLVLGDIEVENSEFDDLVIARSDGAPTYNLVAVVDDIKDVFGHKPAAEAQRHRAIL